MYRLILKMICLSLLFFVMENNTVFAQSTIKISLVTLAGKDSGNLSITTLKGIKSLEVNAPTKLLSLSLL